MNALAILFAVLRIGKGARGRVPGGVSLLALLLTGCATHELVLSRTLKPVLSGGELSFPVAHFHARVQMGRLEVWARVRRGDEEYRRDFGWEIESTATLCAALAKSSLTFANEWRVLQLELTNEYGSQWRWRNTLGYAKVRMDRETLRDLGSRQAPASEYPKRWRLFAYKVGPPDFVPYEWSPAGGEASP